MTIEKLAELVGVTDRYIYRIENERKKPSFEVLHKIIQVLHIDPDLIFYSRKPTKDSEMKISSECFTIAMNVLWKL